MYSLISLSGLILAFAVSFLILIYAITELSVNREFVNGNRIYRIVNHLKSTSSTWAVTVKDLGPQVEASIGDLNGVTRMLGSRKSTKIIVENKKIETQSMFVDNDFFKMFKNHNGIDESISFPDAYSVVISRKLANLLSPDEILIGKSLELEVTKKNVSVKVISIIDGFTEKSNIQADLIMSMDLFDKTNEAAILDVHPFFQTFVMLKQGVQAEQVQAALDAMDQDHFDGTKATRYQLQPFPDFYLDSAGLANHHYETGDKSKIQLFITVASLLLLIAIVNYTILATANALYRQKEFGIRKSFGSDRRNIRLQTLSESMSIAFIALPISIILTELLLPFANNFWGKELDFHTLRNWPILLTFFSLSIITGLISGAYLSFYVSKLNPTLILSGVENKNKSGLTVRKSLIVIQIFIFVVLSSFSVLVLKQMDYFQSKPLGYEPENLIAFDLVQKDSQRNNRTNAARIESFLDEINSHHLIELAAYFSKNMPPYKDNTGAQGVTTAENPNEIKIFVTVSGDHNITEVLKVKIIEGKSLQKGHYNKLLLTETGLKYLGLTDPIGKTINAGGTYEISGIVADFHVQSFRKDIAPLLLRNYQLEDFDDYHYRVSFGIRYKAGAEHESTNYLRNKMAEYFPSYEIENWGFQEDRIKSIYTKEQKVSQTVILGVIIVILISSMGLFALSLYEAERRIKEIAIRKISGANTFNVVILLTRDFTKWVILAFVLAIPVSYFLMNQWLENFIYQTLIAWWIFPLIGLITLFIAWGTISFQSIRAAKSNPVSSLRND